jgi:protoheme IX farnesyltransferase
MKSGLLTNRLEAVRDYWILTKPEVNFLVLVSTLAGFYLASAGQVDGWRLLQTLAGTLLVASGTATLNQYMERNKDARMRRTAQRPLPSGRMQPGSALSFGVLISLAGCVYLLLATNWLAGLLAFLTETTYLLAYTPLKAKTPLCTLVGAFPGAAPPLIGWAAARGTLGLEAWVLYAILFFWQFPHFLSIAWMYREDYARAGLQMIPGHDLDGRFTGREVFTFTLALLPVSLIPVFVGHAGMLYMAGASLLGGFFLINTGRMACSRTNAVARRVLLASVVYLPLVLGLLMLDRVGA